MSIEVKVLLPSLPATLAAPWPPYRVFGSVHLASSATSFPLLPSTSAQFALTKSKPPSWLFRQHLATPNLNSFESSKTQPLSEHARFSVRWFYSASRFWLITPFSLTTKAAFFVALSIVLGVSQNALELFFSFEQRSHFTSFVFDLPSFFWVKRSLF